METKFRMTTHHCAMCGHPSSAIRHDVIDVWPAGIAGFVAYGKYRLRRIRWRRVAATAWRFLAGGISATVAVTLLLLVMLVLADAA